MSNFAVVPPKALEEEANEEGEEMDTGKVARIIDPKTKLDQ